MFKYLKISGVLCKKTDGKLLPPHTISYKGHGEEETVVKLPGTKTPQEADEKCRALGLSLPGVAWNQPEKSLDFLGEIKIRPCRQIICRSHLGIVLILLLRK